MKDTIVVKDKASMEGEDDWVRTELSFGHRACEGGRTWLPSDEI